MSEFTMEAEQEDSEVLDQLSDERLLETLEGINYQVEELDAGAKIIREILMDRLTEVGIDSKVVGEWGISKITRVTFPGISLEKAKELGAVKEAIDTTLLNKLHKQNVPLPGVETSTYLRVTKVKETTE